MIKKLLIITIVFFVCAVLFGCVDSNRESSSDSDKYSEYELYHIDVLVPTTCKASVISSLENEKDENQLEYEYREFMGTPEAYSNIDGYVALKTSHHYPKRYLFDVRIKLLNSCYSLGSISLKRDGSEWDKLKQDVDYLKARNIPIHSIKINDEHIKIFLNMDEYKGKSN